MQSSSEKSTHASVAVRDWLHRFATAVRSRDFAAGRTLFVDDVVAFGSVQSICRSRDELERDQWRDVWPRTSNYQIDLIDFGQQGDIAWAAAQWSSVGHLGEEIVRRSGRVTFVLQRDGGAWRAIHSHHSFDPDPTQRR